MNTHRRKSLIPKPSLPSLRKESTKITPTSSPHKQDSLQSSGSPISPSKIPLSTSTTGSSVSSNISRKRTVSSTLDNYLSTLQTHITADVEEERFCLSEILLEIDSRLSHYHQLCTQLRDLQKREAKLSNTIFEYEIGIPVKQSLLDQESLQVEDDLLRVKNEIEAQKSAYAKVIKHKEEKLIGVLQELVNDAERDDAETIKIRSSRLQLLDEEKEELLKEIEVAKLNMNTELDKFRQIFSSNRELKEQQFQEIKEKLDIELQNTEKEHEKLQKEHSELKCNLSEDCLNIESLEKEIHSKKTKIEELQYRLSDMKSLISELQLDLNNALTLYSNFHDGEYMETKTKWKLAKSRLQEERHKRLKIEIQIRELSGIPNIMILDTEQNRPLQSSSLSEFFKPADYDWKSELFTVLESALEGVSSCVFFLKENQTDERDLRKEIESHLKGISDKQDRFSSYNTNIINLDTLDAIKNILGESSIFETSVLPTATNALFVEMINPDSLSIRKAIIILIYVSSKSDLNLNQIRQVLESVQCITLAEDVSESWSDILQSLASLKPIRLRSSYSFLNKSTNK